MSSPFLTRLHSPDRPVIVSTGQWEPLRRKTSPQKTLVPQYEGCNEYLVHTKPEAVEKVHRDFLAVGADELRRIPLALHRLCWRV